MRPAAILTSSVTNNPLSAQSSMQVALSMAFTAVSWVYYLSPLHTYFQKRELLRVEANAKKLEEENAELEETSLHQKQERLGKEKGV